MSLQTVGVHGGKEPVENYVRVLCMGDLHGRVAACWASLCRRGNKGMAVGLTWELKTWAAGLGLSGPSELDQVKRWPCIGPVWS